MHSLHLLLLSTMDAPMKSSAEGIKKRKIINIAAYQAQRL
jgi:hypothetical protein